MAPRRAIFAMAMLLLPTALAAQTVPVITMDHEPHHHLALRNDMVEVFEVNLAPHDAFLMHRHDQDDVAVVLGEATTVGTAPGRADILRIWKGGEVLFARSGRVHAVRNIGKTPYRMVSIDLLRPQTGARNLCGTQVPDMKPDCAAAADSDGPGSGLPQFETDQIRVTLARIRPHEQASFGEADRDELIVAMDEAAVASAAGKPDQTLAPGGPLWLARGGTKCILKNESGKELRVVTVAFKP
jgi:quercetin dioxygenase-like cupin family protein